MCTVQQCCCCCRWRSGVTIIHLLPELQKKRGRKITGKRKEEVHFIPPRIGVRNSILVGDEKKEHAMNRDLGFSSTKGGIRRIDNRGRGKASWGSSSNGKLANVNGFSFHTREVTVCLFESTHQNLHLVTPEPERMQGGFPFPSSPATIEGREGEGVYVGMGGRVPLPPS